MTGNLLRVKKSGLYILSPLNKIIITVCGYGDVIHPGLDLSDCSRVKARKKINIAIKIFTGTNWCYKIDTQAEIFCTEIALENRTVFKM